METQPQAEVSHVHLLVAIETMKESVGQLKKEVETLNTNHKEHLARITRAEIRIAQGVILAFVLSLVFPIVINAMDPRVQFGDQKGNVR